MLLREKFSGLKWDLKSKIIMDVKGQVTIFFATTIVVMITLMAFIINIGVFVKAKINLQNATDAAAYAGASVQARQLTNIAYLNWEMRNIYKEWMFKYYVLGGINLQGVITPASSGPMQFTMQEYQTGPRPAIDSYNFPSTCIDFAQTGSVGLCTKYLIPGLPRFKSDQVLGMSETTNAFIDSIVAQKNKDCSARSQINFYSANTWAFNVTETEDDSLKNMRDLAPEIAAGRMGAFPKAFEVALRIRNLEAQVNKPARSGVCFNPAANPNCNESIRDIIGNDLTPSNERINKAFYSGFRNLGSESDSELRHSFTLTEIAPQDVDFGSAYSLSKLLIPNGAAQTKRYLDLKLMTVNYAAFYTAFTSNQDAYIINGQTVKAEGQCTATKMGLPIPGYPLGFVKNPDLITYYAVKGEAQFIGLFNPFQNLPIKLTAFAAAKPFGGRIGPMLFNTNDPTTVFPRKEGRRSSPYISALDTERFLDQFGDPLGIDYKPGVPLPLNLGGDQFWLKDASSAIGGYAGSGQSIFFGIPNLAYDYASGIDSRLDYTSDNADIQIITAISSVSSAGLYNPQVFQKLQQKLKGIGSSVSIQAIEDGILMAKSPTLLDANNYLIPTPEDLNAEVETDSFGTIHSKPQRSDLEDNVGNIYDLYIHNMYAPIFSEASDSIYTNASQIQTVLQEYLAAQEPAINKYINSMGLAAQSMYKFNNSNNTGQNLAIEAARGISDLPDNILAGNPGDVGSAKPSCASIAGQFAFFYLGNQSGIQDSAACPTPLPELMFSRWNNFGFKEAYPLEYTLPRSGNDEVRQKVFTAYRPGQEHDANNSGVQTNRSSGTEDKMVRNYYSTKFIPLRSLVLGQQESYGAGIATFSEGSSSRQGAGSDTAQQGFKNTIEPSSVDLDLSKIKH